MPPRRSAPGSSLAAVGSGMGAFRKQLTKEYGDRVAVPELARIVDVVSTGSVTLDLALRRGGWPRGRICELIGQPGSGKTTTVITSMREHQLRHPDLAVGYIDMEQTFDYEWAESHGLDTSAERFLHVFPRDSEDVADVLRKIVDSPLFSCVVVDSIGGMESRKALVKDAEDTLPGRNAQVITRMVKVAATRARLTGKTILLVNQFRANIGGYGPDEIAAGPKILGYATTVQVTFRRTAEKPLTVKLGGVDEEVGRQFRARVVRAKTFASGLVAEYWILNQPSEKFGPVGIWRADEALVLGLRMKEITLAGAWYTLPGGEQVQGEAATRLALAEQPSLIQAIREKAIQQIGSEDSGD